MVHTAISIGAVALAVIFSPTVSHAQTSSDPLTTCVIVGVGTEPLCLGEMSRGALKGPNSDAESGKRFDNDERPVSPRLYR
ncbi:MAG: hypothetical protein JWL62_2927 [Hyphomicrobiales bacterium]|nr:hypothetical protein [Hyphomicrobiales bacterium]